MKNLPNNRNEAIAQLMNRLEELKVLEEEKNNLQAKTEALEEQVKELERQAQILSQEAKFLEEQGVCLHKDCHDKNLVPNELIEKINEKYLLLYSKLEEIGVAVKGTEIRECYKKQEELDEAILEKKKEIDDHFEKYSQEFNLM